MKANGIIEVNNVPSHASKYIIARLDAYSHTLWYWGSWDSLEDAEKALEDIEGALLVEKI